MNIKVEFFQDDFIQAIGAGIYQISINQNNKSEVLYIGESVFVLVRSASHLYKLKSKPEYFGFTYETIDNPGITLKFSIIEENSDCTSRKKRERELIKKRKPLSQNGISDRQKNVEEKIKALTQFLNDSNEMC
ncbi:GIY-YIG nuclease family protein [Rossellomorea sp. LjRoot5]|uniref:GIY-YIG nuclease family protein n=1 Tax=Rossellomorea sp. LjRoot5 TaxID=3342331 RepID=UPI003ECF9B05